MRLVLLYTSSVDCGEDLTVKLFAHQSHPQARSSVAIANVRASRSSRATHRRSLIGLLTWLLAMPSPGLGQATAKQAPPRVLFVLDHEGDARWRERPSGTC